MKVLVVGDVIVDRYTYGEKIGVSAETPTVVAKYNHESLFVGGAGLVVRNLLRLGNEVTFLTTGPEGLLDLFKKCHDSPLPKEMENLTVKTYELPGWKYSEKRRYYVDDYKMVQYDEINGGRYTQHQPAAFLQKFRETIDKESFAAVVISDNRHGVLTHEIARGILNIAKTYRVRTYVDSQVSQNSSNHSWYEGADWISVNMAEAIGLLTLCGRDPHTFDQLPKIFDTNFVIKMGPGGAQIQRLEKYPPGVDARADLSFGFRVNAVDTCGAGDAFLAAFVTHGNLEEANRWAALSTTYKGTIVPRMGDLSKVTRETPA